VASSKIQLPNKEELKRRLNELIPADEIERERAFYLHGLMFFTEEHLREADEQDLFMFLSMTIRANILDHSRPVDIDSIIDSIVAEHKALASALKASFAHLSGWYRQVHSSRN
jgi:hypothetical protein